MGNGNTDIVAPEEQTWSLWGSQAAAQAQAAAQKKTEDDELLKRVTIPSKAAINQMTSTAELLEKRNELEDIRALEYNKSKPSAGIKGVFKFLGESIWKGTSFYDINATDPASWMPLGPDKYTPLYRQIVTAMANINVRVQQIDNEYRKKQGDAEFAYKQSGSTATQEQYTQQKEGLAYLQRMTPQELVKWFIRQDEYLDTPIQTKAKPDIIDVDKETGEPIYAEDTKNVEAREQENRERVLQLGMAALGWLASDKNRRRKFKMELRKWGKTTEGITFIKKYTQGGSAK